jgi:hypothetical protein
MPNNHIFPCALLASIALSTVAQPNLLEGLVTDKSSATIPKAGLLTVGQQFSDLFFHTKIIRLSDCSATSGKVCKPPYSPTPAWNADESLLMVWHRNPWAYVFYDGKTYKELRRVTSINPNDLEMFWWHPTKPDLLYFPEGKTLKQYSYSANQITDYHTFTQYASLSSDGHNFPFSWDGKYFGYTGDLQGGGSEWFVFDMERKSMVVAKSGSGTALMSPSGNYILVENEVYDAATLAKVRTLSWKTAEHNDLGMWDGEDYQVRVNFDDDPNGIAAYKLSDGSVRSLIPGYYPPTATHISCKNYNAQGWCIISSIGSDAIGGTVRAFHKEIYIAKLDGSGAFGRVCHHRSSEEVIDYWGEPHVVFSPGGTRACFGSDWEDHGYVDAYVVELPGYDSSTKVVPYVPPVSSVNVHFSVSDFHGTTLIRYSLPRKERVKIEVYNSRGFLLQALDHSLKSAGSHSIQYKPRTSGVYYFRLIAGKNRMGIKTVTVR